MPVISTQIGARREQPSDKCAIVSRAFVLSRIRLRQTAMIESNVTVA